MKLEKVLFILEKEFKIKPERKGNSFFFLCPFHKDKNPSLSMEPKRMFFNCFGCDFKAKNIYYFWSKYKNISIEETFEELSALGYIKPVNKKKLLIDEDNNYKNSLDIISSIYTNNLFSHEGKTVLKYLKEERKIGKSTIEDFRIGASISSDQIVMILQKKENEKFAKSAIELGLITTKNEEDNFDFFWKKQVIIPIENSEGEIVLIASRKIINGENKYIFLPSTIVCEKSSTIYNYKNLLNSNEEFCYIVEGFFDVLSLYERGVKNCISFLGTSVSSQQLEMIKNLKKKFLIFFDGDRAGKEGSILVSSSLMRKGIDCEIIKTEFGKDPDEICKEEKLSQELEKRSNPFVFSIEYYENVFQIKENPQRLQSFLRKVSQSFWWTNESIRKFLAEKISESLNTSYEETWKIISSEMEEAEGFEPSRVPMHAY